MPLFFRLVFAMGVAIPIALLSSDAGAIPVFARKYQTACTTCHFASFPQLNAFGVAFRDRGYRIPPDDEVYVKETPVSMGVEPWKKLFPNAVWPSDMPGLPPLSIITGTGFDYTPHKRPDVGEHSFSGIGEVELLASGNFGESLSFFGALALFEKGNNYQPSNTELERWFAVYSPQILGLPLGRVNIRAGRFSPRAGLFNTHTNLLSSFVPDFANTWTVVPASNATVFFPSQRGIELFGGLNGPGGKGGLRWALGVVNGEPTDPSIEDWEIDGYPRLGNADVAPISMHRIMGSNGVSGAWDGKGDINNSKDFYGSLYYKIGGMGVLGSSTQEASLKMAQNWQDPSLTLGGFFYRGTTGAFKDFTDTGSDGIGDPHNFHSNSNRFWRFGGDVTVNWWNLELNGAATYYRDKVSGGVRWVNGARGTDFNTDIYTAKLDYVALPWLIPSYRYERVCPDYDVGDWPSITRHTALLTTLIRANIKLITGAAFVSSIDSPRGGPFDNKYTLALDFAF